MTIKNLYPKARPQTIYNVINGRPELPAASTFSRASEATYVDANGIIRTAGVDKPRFNYDPVTGEFLGLFLEEERTNLLTYSEEFENPAWTQQTGLSIDSTLVTGPDGNLSGRKLLGFDAFAGERLSETIVINNSTLTGSIWLKGEGSNIGKDVMLTVKRSGGAFAATNFVHTLTADWVRVDATFAQLSGNTGVIFTLVSSGVNPASEVLVYGGQLEIGSLPTSYIPTTGSAVTRKADAFSLTSSSNFDGGFSLLLDSETTTDDYFYKIKASGTTIAELNNANGTLDWVINGVSAATNGEYPQVGAIQPGRVRTVSSFGAADGTTQQNYLYTEGLSFPTNAIVASGAHEVEFGTGQTLKALYLWNGQLSNTEAVSVIKGEYNIVPNEPIKADSYSFVYNTDPTNVGETAITLPYIVPTVSMRVYWGDGTNSAYEQGVTPSHTYPYPGQYRIQIEAADGFNAVRLGGSLYPNIITRLDQWAPQFRVGASGPGFTGDQLSYILNNQKALGGTIPTFKYTDLTNLASAFSNCTGQVTPINLAPWEYIPTNLPLVTTLASIFSALGRYNNEATPDRTNFPTLQTSSLLTNVSSCFANTKIPNFVNDRPFADTSNVTNFQNCFSGALLTNCIIDTSSGTNLKGLFARNDFTISPSIDTSNATDMEAIMSQNNPLTTQLFWDTSSVTNFASSWSACPLLNNFPQIDTSSGTNFTDTFNGCSGLTSFPLLNTSSCTKFSGAFSLCSQITSMPLIDTSKGIQFNDCFRSMANLTNMPLLDMSNGTTFASCWNACTSLVNFPAIDMPSATSIRYAWNNCSNLGSFSAIDLTSCTDFYAAWRLCSSLVDFPANMFDTTGTLTSTAFGDTWKSCALTAQSIENILVSLDANGQSNIQLGIDGGTNAAKTTWTAAANTAYTNLINKGWTITFNP